MTTTSRAVLLACGVVLGGGVASAGGPATTSTTTTTSAVSTTTTLFGGCEVSATFESILCRLDALGAWIESSNDLGRMKQGLSASAANARTRCGRAQTATGRTVTNQLRRCSKTLQSFRHRVGSLIGRRVIAEDVRDLLRDGVAAPLRSDILALRRTL
jgi:hypothetical protein